jgi:hypothetical protein
MKKYIVFFTILVVSSIHYSCKKFVDTPLPTDKIPSDAALNSDASLVAACSGAYASVLNIASTTVVLTNLFADDMLISNATSTNLQAQENTYDPTTPDYGFFSNYYKAIYNANLILETLEKSNNVTPAVSQQIKGECKFLRAFCYYRLASIYGNPPLVLTSDVTGSALIGNTPKEQIYESIIADLQDAKLLLTEVYPSADRVRANKYAATALLARIYLLKQDWVNAEAEASSAIGATTLYNLPSDLNTVFLKGSPETIWQLWNVNGNVPFATTFIPSTTSTVFYQLRVGLVNAFEATDKRKAAWIKAGTGAASANYYPFKYKQRAAATGTSTEYQVMLRLGEQYLIRAEARAQQNKVEEGLADLNKIHLRANVLPIVSLERLDLLLKIEQERRLELMTEEGLRWFDLNRTGRTAFWLSPIKPTFKPRAVLLPYYVDYLIANPNLKQNSDY